MGGGLDGTDEDTMSARQEHLAYDVCEGQPKASDPNSDYDFLPKCASCISRVAVIGENACYENTWTFETHCGCYDLTFHECDCWRRMNIVGAICYIALPALVLFLIIIAATCKKFKFCPLAKMEAELASQNKEKAKGKKAKK